MSQAERFIDVDGELAAQLVAAQFPQWRGLAPAAVRSDGTDNALFRLGPSLVARFPRRETASAQAAKEARWLPELAPRLPLPIPAPLALGAASDAFPWAWSVCPWFDGADGASAPVADLVQAAADLGGFLAALRAADAANGPAAGMENSGRGLPLARLDERVRRDIAVLGAEIDGRAVLAVWEDALSAPVWGRPGAWVHGDLHPGNLLVRDGRIAAVLDFGLLGVGDPAADLIVAWSWLDAGSRPAFRDAAALDAAAWRRGRGWAVFNAVIALAYYLHANPALCAMSRRTLSAVTA